MGIKKKQVPGCTCCGVDQPPPPPPPCFEDLCVGNIETMSITIGGITDGTGTGSDCCDQINGTYDIDISLFPSGCHYEYNIAPNFCTPLAGYTLNITLDLSDVNSTTSRTTVIVTFVTGGLGSTTTWTFHKDFTKPVNCVNMDGALTFDGEGGNTTKCNGTATCTVTLN